MAVAGERMPVLPRGRRDVVRQARAEAVKHGRDVISVERGLGLFVEVDTLAARKRPWRPSAGLPA
jgi:hypothetical protein